VFCKAVNQTKRQRKCLFLGTCCFYCSRLDPKACLRDVVFVMN